jgi:hypothetical protein
MTKRQEVISFAKQHKISVSNLYSIPMLSKGELMPQCFDNWDQAHAFLSQRQRAYQESGIRCDWLK